MIAYLRFTLFASLVSLILALAIVAVSLHALFILVTSGSAMAIVDHLFLVAVIIFTDKAWMNVTLGIRLNWLNRLADQQSVDKNPNAGSQNSE